MSRKKKNKADLWKKTIIFLSPLAIIYLSISIYFSNHFYYNSVVNCINVSGQTVKEANNTISSEINEYTLQLHGRENVNDEIKGNDIELSYKSNDDLKKIKKSQNPFTWFLGFFNKNSNLTIDMISYNESLLDDYIDNLTYFDVGNIVEPKDANFEFKNNKFEITNEVVGTKVNKEVLREKIINAIKNGEHILDLEEENCYENPNYTKDSKEVIDAKDKLNSMIDLTITYDVGDEKEIVDGSIISNWLNVGEDFEINFDKEKIK